MVRPLLAAAAALAISATVAMATGGPSVKALHVELEGSDPGPDYTVTVNARARVCAKRGAVTLEVRERQTGFDHPPTVTAENSRSFQRTQRKPCQLYTPSWRLRDEFFGAGIYKVRLIAVDRDGERSRGATESIESSDE